MSEKNPTIYEDEIDLLSLLNKIITAVTKYKIAFFSILIAGIVVSTGIYFITPKRYAVRMLADSRVLSSKDVTEITDEFQTLLRSRDYSLLSHKLHLSAKIISQLTSIEAESTSDILSTTDKDAFTISAAILNPEITDSLQKGIINYFENNDYVKSRIAVQRENLMAIKKKTERELAQVDSLKTSIQNMVKRGNGNTFLLEPGSINEKSIALYEKILALEESLKFLDNIHIISGFDKPTQSFFPKLSVYLLIGFAGGLVLALVFVMTRK